MYIINYGEQKVGLFLRSPLYFFPLLVPACSHNSKRVEAMRSNSAQGSVCSVYYHAFLSDYLIEDAFKGPGITIPKCCHGI